MALAAIDLKCAGDVAARCGESFSFSQASWTSAVEFSVSAEFILPHKEAKRRSSS